MRIRQRERQRSADLGANLLQTAIFRSNLTTSLVPSVGSGGPTWSRATKAWGLNELGYLEELASGCAFFGGARLVRNNVRTKSEDFSNAAWVKTVLTVSGTNTVVCANSTSQQYMRQAGATGIVNGMTFLISVRVKYVSGGADFIQILHHGSGFNNSYCNFNLQTGAVQVSGCTATVDAVTGGGFDVHVKAVADTSGAFDDTFIALINSISDTRLQSFVGDGVKSFELLRVRSCDVTNYDASYIPEYVSVGVEASPFFGAGIDGAKYFGTDQNGLALGRDKLIGFRREAAATNNLLYCRDLTQSAWTQTGTSGSEIVTNGAFAADTNWTKGSGWSISAGVATRTDVATISNLAQTVSIFAGTAYVISYDVTISSGNIKATFGGGTTANGIARTATGTYSEVLIANSGNYELRLNASSTFAGTIDNISIKVAAVQCTQVTGLDGIANTATTLTATAADAIILQPTSGIASADRCASAYVKRRTGTGTISFTQDGGSSWTDITSLINASTWSRVQITATLPNPSVGFKISTSGDEIDVDVVQNEAGTVATSPIVTTTATVTRNADSLTYPTAGNIDFAVGTVFVAARTVESSTIRYFIRPGSSYFGVHSSSLATSVRSFDGSLSVTTAGLSDMSTGARKRALSWGGATRSQTGDGAVPTSGAFDGSFGDGASIGIGENLNGYIGPVAIWNYQMTDAQLQEVTK